jgi:hypothetical protein
VRGAGLVADELHVADDSFAFNFGDGCGPPRASTIPAENVVCDLNTARGA